MLFFNVLFQVLFEVIGGIIHSLTDVCRMKVLWKCVNISYDCQREKKKLLFRIFTFENVKKRGHRNKEVYFSKCDRLAV